MRPENSAGIKGSIQAAGPPAQSRQSIQGCDAPQVFATPMNEQWPYGKKAGASTAIPAYLDSPAKSARRHRGRHSSSRANAGFGHDVTAEARGDLASTAAAVTCNVWSRNRETLRSAAATHARMVVRPMPCPAVRRAVLAAKSKSQSEQIQDVHRSPAPRCEFSFPAVETLRPQPGLLGHHATCGVRVRRPAVVTLRSDLTQCP